MPPSAPESPASPDQVAELQTQLAALRSQRRSSSQFRECRPEAFYYLFGLVVAGFLAVLAYGSWRTIEIAGAAGALFVEWCYAPRQWNRFRYWRLIRRPNRHLERRMNALLAEIERLKGQPPAA